MEQFDPVARTIHPDLPRPALTDNRSHESRIRDALEEILGQRPRCPLRVVRNLPGVIEPADYRVQAVVLDGPCGWELVQVNPAAGASRLYGVAVDLGSSTVVFHLVDLATGEIAGTVSHPNPQRAHGEDILARILFAGGGDGLETLQSEIVGLFNSSIEELVRPRGIRPDDVFFVTVAGNTTMCHFLLALDPGHICREPYIPAANRFDLIRAEELGIHVHPLARLFCFPNIGSYFGGDLLSGVLASGMHLRDEISMLIDVGTNAEVVLGNRDWLVACAGAAGPALEGGILSCGVMAQPGAVERVHIDRRSLAVTYRTLGGVAPLGLCGSGVIDLLAAMFLAGLVDPTGKLVVDRDPLRMQRIGGEWAYVVAGKDATSSGAPVYMSQSDLKNLIRSKAAMYTILGTVTQSVGIEFGDIERFYVAGAFGNYIDPKNAVTIGMLPDVPLDRFTGLGNAAGDGAVEVLRRRQAIAEVERIREKMTYLEMNVRGDFMSQLTAALFLPHTDLARFPSVAALAIASPQK
jgi:uncharacterized 2Fe-2S/4Fe-4S cluster protein (DUF4445 family)